MTEEYTENVEQNYVEPLPPEAQSIKDLIKIAGLISLIIGILYLIAGIFTFGLTVIFGIIDIIIWYYCKQINELIDARKYKEAKDKTLIWMIIGIILGGLIPGIILLVAYIKYDELIRVTSQQQAVPPPPPE